MEERGAIEKEKNQSKEEYKYKCQSGGCHLNDVVLICGLPKYLLFTRKW